MKKKFLIDQAIINSISAAFQHAGVYIEEDKEPNQINGIKVNDKQKQTLRTDLSNLLRNFGDSYYQTVTESEHINNISKLADDLTNLHKNSGTLRNNRFRIGVAQKALNLYLKYLWCLDEISTPPHCPLDRFIIDKLELPTKERGDYNWTQLDDINKYKTLIDKCTEKASGLPIAEWELKEWGFSNQKSQKGDSKNEN